MDQKIISGRDLAQKHEDFLKEKITKLPSRIKIVSILVGDDPSSLKYTKIKKDKASELGMDFDYIQHSVSEPFQNVVMDIIKLNNDPAVSGILVQLPLPKEFLKQHSPADLLQNIDPKKDIDGLVENSPFTPATVRGVMSILASINLESRDPSIRQLADSDDKLYAVIGSEGQVGKAMVRELKKQGLLVTEIDIKNPNSNPENIKKADVVISCVGECGVVKPKDVKDGAVLIDVGLGDFDESCYEKVSSYTPAVGGVGPMTVISLFENAIEGIFNN